MDTIIVNAKIYSEDRVVDKGYIGIKNSTISKIGEGEYNAIDGSYY